MAVSPDHPHLPGLQALINTHLEMAIPGWALRHPEQRILDPWVVARRTIFSV